MMKIIRLFKPTAGYALWWFATALTLLTFDIFFCLETSFHAFHNYIGTYFTIIAGASIFTLPAAYTKRRIWQFVTLIALDILLIANLMYCRTYFIAIPLNAYGMGGNLKGFTGSIYDSFRIYDLSLPAIAGSAYLLTRRKQSLPGKLLQPSMSVFSLMLVFATMYPAGGVYKKLDIMANSVNSLAAVTPAYSVFASMAYDYMTESAPLSDDERTCVEQWLSEHRRMTSDYTSPHDISEEIAPRNIIIILCESLESWPIGLTIEGQQITPFINSLINDSTTYYTPNVLTQTRGGRSIDAQLLMLAGQTPIASGVYAMKYSGNTYNTLPKEMRKHGAATYLISPDEPSTWNQKAIARSFGIDSIYMKASFDHTLPGAVNHIDGYLTDESLLSQTADKMKTGELWPENQYAFILIVTHSGHNPFKIDDNLKTIHLNGDYPEILKDYLTVTHFTDNSLKNLIDYLKTRPDWNRTSVIITGDHEGLASYRNDLATAHDFVSREQHTPLIIVNAPFENRKGYNNPNTSQLDIYSTLLDIAGVYNTAKWKGMGQSIFDPKRANAAVGPLGTIEPNGYSNSTIIDHQRASFKIGDLILRHQLDPSEL